jgi:hypothetical protein
MRATNEMIVPAAIGNEIGDGCDLQPVQLREFYQIWQPRHGAVFIHDLADHARRIEACEAGDIDSRFGVPGTDQNTAVAGHERENVARHDNVGLAFGRIDGNPDSTGAVGRGNSRRNSVLGFDGHREGCLIARAVLRRHHRQIQLISALLRQRQADQTASVLGHEIDRLRRAHLRRDDEVALVLTVLSVDQNEHAAVARVFDDVRNGRNVIVKDVHAFTSRPT